MKNCYIGSLPCQPVFNLGPIRGPTSDAWMRDKLTGQYNIFNDLCCNVKIATHVLCFQFKEDSNNQKTSW